MEDCVFCKIVGGKIPCSKIWEDENYLAFLDVSPYIKGHTLVIPKKHFKWVWDLDDEFYCDYLLAVKRVAEVLKRTFNTDCIQEVIAGMGVPHTHSFTSKNRG